jgi:hypothetical protein
MTRWQLCASSGSKSMPLFPEIWLMTSARGLDDSRARGGAVGVHFAGAIAEQLNRGALLRREAE